jgi:hypothetical protein
MIIIYIIVTRACGFPVPTARDYGLVREYQQLITVALFFLLRMFDFLLSCCTLPSNVHSISGFGGGVLVMKLHNLL